MLTTGIRTPVGTPVRGTRSVFAERAGSGYYPDIDWNRDALARYGSSIDEAQAAVQNAIGGENVTTVIQGRERYAVNVRYMRDFPERPGCRGPRPGLGLRRKAADPAS
jgi:Cu(I)/Ag(I) efflux system membrane protein CusA/SilA